MGHEPVIANMNPATSGKLNSRERYHQKALNEIRNSLLPFANGGTSSSDNYSSAASTISTISTTSGVSSASGLSSNSNGLDKDLNAPRQKLSQLINMGYTSEELAFKGLKIYNGRCEVDVEMCHGFGKSSNSGVSPIGSKLMRKPSLEHELNAQRSSPAATMDSGAGSSRSDSPRQSTDILTHLHLSRQYSPNSLNDPPPLPPPRNCSTPPPLPPPHAYPPNAPPNMQMFKRMSPGPVVPLRPAAASPTSNGTQNYQHISARQPMILQNGPQVQQQLTQQIQALNLYQNTPVVESPPPYPVVPPTAITSPPPPSYAASIQSRQSPTQLQPSDFRKSPSSGIYSASTGSASPTSNVSYGGPQNCNNSTATSAVTRSAPVPGWAGSRQTKTQQPIIMQSVKSTQVQKPVLQTAVAPTVPSVSTTTSSPNPPLPSYASSIQDGRQLPPQCHKSVPPQHCPPPPQQGPSSSATVSPVVPTTEPPSYACTMQALAVQRGMNLSPYSKDEASKNSFQSTSTDNHMGVKGLSGMPHPALQRKFSPTESRSESPASASSAESRTPPLPPTNSSSVTILNGVDKKAAYKVDHQSPIPERKHVSKERDEEQAEDKLRNYSPQAYKFFLEQHIENVLKSYKQRMFRRMQLETEMDKIGLSSEAQYQMRKMLSQKESNYIRLKRAKMCKSMFIKIKPIGIGAFGEVTLVRKIDTNHLYAMKTLRKADVLQRNQVAHVKAERDILAEADNEWVVKLYYSFQDKDYLYFVMDYIPGGDLMSLLIKFGIFEESLARFYLAELVCAVESVHKMGFIHRDIKPDNILIDRDGHIKLTDFGLCTGFRWTHNSKYYQRNGDHNRQDSMDLVEGWSPECKCYQKPLERRRKREQHQRCLAHSLVGTPNYIAPEVLERTGYTQLCDWWSVGVILYEMLVGSPPFLANTPAETQHKIIKWRETLKIPLRANVSPEAADLIMKLCTGADRRLGRNANEIKQHSFFASINYNEGVRRLTPPFMPKIQYSTDTSNFDPIDPDKLQNSTLSDSQMFGDELFHGFFEFTFRRFFDEGGGAEGVCLPFPQRINLDENDNQGAVYV